MPTKQPQLLSLDSTPNPYIAKLLSKEEYQGLIVSFPRATLLRDARPPGLFINESNLMQMKWLGAPAESVGAEGITHMYSSGEEETGFLFSTPLLQIVGVSPRFIEYTEQAEADNVGKKYSTPQGNAAVHTFADGTSNPEGIALYSVLRPNKHAQLRTLYLCRLVDADKKPLHETPFIIPVGGTAAVKFGDTIAQFKEAIFKDAQASATEDDTIALPNNDALGMYIFQPQFDILRGQSADGMAYNYLGVKAFGIARMYNTVEEAESVESELKELRQYYKDFGYSYMKTTPIQLQSVEAAAQISQVSTVNSLTGGTDLF